MADEGALYEARKFLAQMMRTPVPTDEFQNGDPLAGLMELLTFRKMDLDKVTYHIANFGDDGYRLTRDSDDGLFIYVNLSPMLQLPTITIGGKGAWRYWQFLENLKFRSEIEKYSDVRIIILNN